MSTAIAKHRIVSEQEWVKARMALMAEEKALTRKHDELARKRRELPWVKVEKKYEFEGPNGKVGLGDLFDGRSQLLVYHFMFGPDWKEGCQSCSFLVDHVDGALVHMRQRDVTWTAISRAPWPKIEAYKKRMGWHIPWVSAYGSEFNWDFHVSFTKEQMEQNKAYYNFGTITDFPSDEAPGISAFYKDEDGEIFHTYSTFARGGDVLLGTYNWLDMTAKGRHEEGLPYPMAWVRRHDEYPEVSGSGAKKEASSCCEHK